MGSKKLTSLKTGFSGLKTWKPYVPNPIAAIPVFIKKKKKKKIINNNMEKNIHIEQKRIGELKPETAAILCQ